MNVLVLHGPNLDLLGRRPGDEPSLNLPALDRRIAERARGLGLIVRALQSNHEGALLDALRNPGDWAEAVVLSPGLLALTSHVLREAVAGSRIPVVEVQLHDGSGKASVRRHSLLQDVCVARVVGEGPDGYLRALERLVSAARRAAPPPTPAKKTLGRGERSRPAAAPPTRAERGAAGPPAARASAPAAPPAKKTLGRRAAPDSARPGGPPAAGRVAGGALSRAAVRQRIADRLGGGLTPAGLSTWARTQWLELQRGAPVESGQRELLEDTLQQLLLGEQKPSRLGEDQLVELMTALDG
ncbi:MAG TPA: type II 3-dehydroquinate dehydratase [Myxococcaceae bacterium]|nr:type II 3-dehydroquinate dehydratase [Myxococcaceae bacterium]